MGEEPILEWRDVMCAKWFSFSWIIAGITVFPRGPVRVDGVPAAGNWDLESWKSVTSFSIALAATEVLEITAQDVLRQRDPLSAGCAVTPRGERSQKSIE